MLLHGTHAKYGVLMARHCNRRMGNNSGAHSCLLERAAPWLGVMSLRRTWARLPWSLKMGQPVSGAPVAALKASASALWWNSTPSHVDRNTSTCGAAEISLSV